MMKERENREYFFDCLRNCETYDEALSLVHDWVVEGRVDHVLMGELVMHLWYNR